MKAVIWSGSALAACLVMPSWILQVTPFSMKTPPSNRFELIKKGMKIEAVIAVLGKRYFPAPTGLRPPSLVWTVRKPSFLWDEVVFQVDFDENAVGEYRVARIRRYRVEPSTLRDAWEKAIHFLRP